MIKKRWTEQDIEILRSHYKDKTSFEIGKLLGRGSDSIKHKARKLGLSLRKKGDKCSWSKYSEDSVEGARILHDNGMKPKQISDFMDIPLCNVRDFVYYKRN